MMADRESLRLPVDSWDADQATRLILAAHGRHGRAARRLIDPALASIRAREPGWIDAFDRAGTIVVIAGPRLLEICCQLMELDPPP